MAELNKLRPGPLPCSIVFPDFLTALGTMTPLNGKPYLNLRGNFGQFAYLQTVAYNAVAKAQRSKGTEVFSINSGTRTVYLSFILQCDQLSVMVF